MASKNKRRRTWQQATCVLALLCCAAFARASEQGGQVTFNGAPMPGALVTATQGSKKVTAVSGADGYYRLLDLPDGAWKVTVTMLCFAPQEQNVTVGPNEPGIRWDLKMLPLDQVIAQTKIVKAPVLMVEAPPAPDATAKKEAPKPGAPAAPPPPAQAASDSNANDGFLVNGSVNNAATSQYSLAQAFGNTRSGSRAIYNGNFAVNFGNSVLNATQYPVSGVPIPKLPNNQITLTANIGGPLNIPHLMPHGPNFNLGYIWTRNSNANSLTGLVPTLDQRAGILPDGTITNINPQAQALLALYPLPNIAGNTAYNYQLPVLFDTHLDQFRTGVSKAIGKKGDYVNGLFAISSTRASSTNLFGFTDPTDTLGINSSITWSHRFHSITTNTTYQFSRQRNGTTPYFSNRTNFSGAAGINGNDQDPVNWGPPSLSFSSGIVGLSDGIYSDNRNETNQVNFAGYWYHSRHNIALVADYKRQEFNQFQQTNPRGTLGFTGTTTGKSDFANFLNGIPDTSTIAFGNADKYLRASIYDAGLRDDWRVRPELSLNIGVRWEYSSPISELKDRLVNLDIAPGFTAVAPVLASAPVGSLTGTHLPDSLIRPTKNRFQPKIGLAWTPIPGSSLRVSAGYDVSADTSVYMATAQLLDQQSPLSTSLNVQNSASCPLTLANGFNPCSISTANTFAVDPNWRVGYVQNWNLNVQRDLPAAMQMLVSYLGTKGTRATQDFYPNSYPAFGTNPCPQCPSGFLYRTSNGNSTREAGSIQLRRRLKSGFTASALYTYSKAIDDASALGGPTGGGGSSSIAQNWQNLRGERSLSGFDQRHTLNFSATYTSGMGLGGGTLLGGWRGKVLKEWTILTTVTAATGKPETPIYGAVLNGAGSGLAMRPNRTSAPLYLGGQNGRYLNPDAFSAPLPGQYGNAGRYSMTGPGQFTFNASMARTFRLNKRYSLDVSAAANNVLNHVVFTSYNYALSPLATGISDFSASSPQFGAPATANGPRTVQLKGTLRF